MAIFTQLTSTLFIICLTFSSGVNATGSSSNCDYYGKLEHNGGVTQPSVINANNVKNTLKVSGPERFKECSVKMQVENEECIAKHNQKVSCQITGDKLKGNLTFTIPTGKKIYIPFENAQFFSGNICDIQLGEYDIKNNNLTLKINGNGYKITPTKENVEVRCGARANTV